MRLPNCPYQIEFFNDANCDAFEVCGAAGDYWMCQTLLEDEICPEGWR